MTNTNTSIEVFLFKNNKLLDGKSSSIKIWLEVQCMKYLVIISTLFVIGSLFGWVLELFFRRFVSQKKWVNPGFLTGPYLPIYGCGVVVLYSISNIPLPIENELSDE